MVQNLLLWGSLTYLDWNHERWRLRSTVWVSSRTIMAGRGSRMTWRRRSRGSWRTLVRLKLILRIISLERRNRWKRYKKNHDRQTINYSSICIRKSRRKQVVKKRMIDVTFVCCFYEKNLFLSLKSCRFRFEASPDNFCTAGEVSGADDNLPFFKNWVKWRLQYFLESHLRQAISP